MCESLQIHVVMMRELGKPRGLADPALPKAIENVGSTTVPVSHDTFSEADEARDYKFCHVLLATLEGDAMDEVLNLPRATDWNGGDEPVRDIPSKTSGHCRTRLEHNLYPVVGDGCSCQFGTLGESSQGVRASDHRQSGKS